MTIYPTVSVVVATFNSERTLAKCLSSIRGQDYPQNKIEIIVADGGSKDRTREIAKSFGAKIYRVDPAKQNAEYNKSIGISRAKNEILAMVDHDNVLPHKRWLQNMVKPFLESKEIVGVETLRYHYDPTTSLIDRYFALFGAGDPIVWYLGKADRLSYIFDQYNLAGQAVDRGSYYEVIFKPDNISTIGANGFLVRRLVLMKNAKAGLGEYFDMDVNVDLINKGFNHYAFVKDSILHLTGYGSVIYYLKRRLLFVKQYHLSEKSLALNKIRRYAVYGTKNFWRLLYTAIICLTVVVPVVDSIRGWRKIHDSAWFLHPFMCMSFVVLYGWVIMKHQTSIYVKKLLVG